MKQGQRRTAHEDSGPFWRYSRSCLVLMRGHKTFPWHTRFLLREGERHHAFRMRRPCNRRCQDSGALVRGIAPRRCARITRFFTIRVCLRCRRYGWARLFTGRGVDPPRTGPSQNAWREVWATTCIPAGPNSTAAPSPEYTVGTAFQLAYDEVHEQVADHGFFPSYSANPLTCVGERPGLPTAGEVNLARGEMV